MEQWKPVKEYEELYEVSNLGNIRRTKDNYIFHKNINSGGYIVVTLTKNGVEKSYLLHRLVASAFIPNPLNKPQINHISGVKTNNKIDNLEWCTGSENMQHCYKNNLQKRGFKRVNQYTLDNQFVRTWESLIQIERELNINHSKISNVCNGKRNKAGNYIWRFADE